MKPTTGDLGRRRVLDGRPIAATYSYRHPAFSVTAHSIIRFGKLGLAPSTSSVVNLPLCFRDLYAPILDYHRTRGTNPDTFDVITFIKSNTSLLVGCTQLVDRKILPRSKFYERIGGVVGADPAIRLRFFCEGMRSIARDSGAEADSSRFLGKFIVVRKPKQSSCLRRIRSSTSLRQATRV